ncbi:MAG: hypothetical protein RJQ08_03785 [Salinisphaeraceae bacterium]
MATINGTIIEYPRKVEISTCFEDRRVVMWEEFAADNADDPQMLQDVAYWLAVNGFAHIGGGAAPLFRIRRAR